MLDYQRLVLPLIGFLNSTHNLNEDSFFLPFWLSCSCWFSWLALQVSCARWNVVGSTIGRSCGHARWNLHGQFEGWIWNPRQGGLNKFLKRGGNKQPSKLFFPCINSCTSRPHFGFFSQFHMRTCKNWSTSLHIEAKNRREKGKLQNEYVSGRFYRTED